MAQSLSKLNVHLVFSTKNRRPLIGPEIERPLFSYMAAILSENCNSPARIVGGWKDHVHILFSLARSTSVAEVVKEVKARSSRWIKKRGDDYSDFWWQAGYGAFSVSQSDLPRVIAYIANQRIHHQKRTFREEFLLLLKKHEVEYDERLIWA